MAPETTVVTPLTHRAFPIAPIAVGFLLVVILLFGFGLTLYGIYVVLAVLIVSRLMTQQSLTNLVESRTLSRRQLEAGDAVTVTTEVRNAGKGVVLWALMEDFVRDRAQVTGERLRIELMRPGKVALLKYTARLPFRGYYPFGPIMLETGDLFGLVRKFRVGAEVDFVTVLPKVVPIAQYGVPTQRPIGEVRVQSLIFEDPTRLVGVRQYERGDSLKRIHWKATARTGIMQSKVYEPTTMLGATLALDFHAASWAGERGFERSEFSVTAAASIAAFILQHKQQVGFISNGRDAVERVKLERATMTTATRSAMRTVASEELKSERLRPFELPARRGDTHIHDTLVALARLEQTDGLTFAEMLATEYHRLPRDNALIVLLGRFTRDTGEVLIEMKRCGFLVVVFVIDSNGEFQQTVAYLMPEGLRCGHLRTDQDLQQLETMRI